MVKLIRSVSLFKSFNTEELYTLLRLTDTLHFNSHEFIFQEGDKDHSLYIIIRGSVQIMKTINEEEDIELAFMRTGDYFGELSLIDNEPRSASVRTFEETEVLRLTDLAYQELARKHQTAEVKMLRAFVRDISRRLRTTNEMWSHFKNLIF